MLRSILALKSSFSTGNRNTLGIHNKFWRKIIKDCVRKYSTRQQCLGKCSTNNEASYTIVSTHVTTELFTLFLKKS